MATTEKTSQRISIIGLGQMGKKIAELYKLAGYEVTVWNRTRAKITDLEDVYAADTALEAVLASPLSIICVYDNSGTLELLKSVLGPEKLKGRTVVNFTTGSPKEATEIEKMIEESAGYYINGAIQVAPDQMGLADTTILIAGNSDAYRKNKDAFTILGGNVKHLGEGAAASSAMDLATLTWLYGSYVGLIYGVKLSQQYALKLEDFSAIIGDIAPGFTEFFKYEVDVIRRGDYGITQSPLAISVAATQRIAASFKALNVDQAFPQTLAKILEVAKGKGLGNEELAAISKAIEQ